MAYAESFFRTCSDFGGTTRQIALKAALVGLAFAVFPCFAGSASAESAFHARGADFIRVIGAADPTQAWTRFCRRYPRECGVDLSQPARISLSPAVWATLTSVNERVNASILSVTDQDRWGVLDRWDYPDDGLGDCEDIQLLKRKLLVQAGLSQRALRMAAVIDEQGQGHAVLMVLTDRGDFILDNKRNDILSWRQAGYTFVKREGTNGKSWVALGDRTAPAITANR
ncbi:transglutaminase-like cysteine peptidase [Microvirga pakistanensis]|uniref:transglutaminase-like cysteine peptidase n=1 Tax=Microvirga pakistanensis TaxID=1682650 RepID=UPI00106BA15E|nr:transglutaminase-like cysteine peptidase [Microvirga pakistanensis]